MEIHNIPKDMVSQNHFQHLGNHTLHSFKGLPSYFLLKKVENKTKYLCFLHCTL